MSTIVTGSINTLQLFALIAVILFVIAGVYAAIEKTVWAVIVSAGLAFASAALLFHP